MRNVHAAVRYAREILRSSTGDKVLIDREKLRTIVIAAESSPRGRRDKSIADVRAWPK